VESPGARKEKGRKGDSSPCPPVRTSVIREEKGTGTVTRGKGRRNEEKGGEGTDTIKAENPYENGGEKKSQGSPSDHK